MKELTQLKLNGVEAIEYLAKMIQTIKPDFYVKIRGNYVEIGTMQNGTKDKISCTFDGFQSYTSVQAYLAGVLEGITYKK